MKMICIYFKLNKLVKLPCQNFIALNGKCDSNQMDMERQSKVLINEALLYEVMVRIQILFRMYLNAIQ